MMYNHDFVVCLKTDNGKILQEDKNVVYLPFNSEYSILMKNLREVKVLVSVSIDGSDVLNGRKLIIDANTSIQLERFFDTDPTKGARFKFIRKTSKISLFRGDKIDDGILRVEFWFEKKKPTIIVVDDKKTDVTEKFSTIPYNRSGITARGSESHQQFQIGSIGPLEEQSNVATMMIKGAILNNTMVDEPRVFSRKKTCKICGTVNKGNGKFCKECGNNLTDY